MANSVCVTKPTIHSVICPAEAITNKPTIWAAEAIRNQQQNTSPLVPYNPPAHQSRRRRPSDIEVGTRAAPRLFPSRRLPMSGCIPFWYRPRHSAGPLRLRAAMRPHGGRSMANAAGRGGRAAKALGGSASIAKGLVEALATDCKRIRNRRALQRTTASNVRKNAPESSKRDRRVYVEAD